MSKKDSKDSKDSKDTSKDQNNEAKKASSNSSPKNPKRLEQETEQARDNLRETLDSLGRNLSPSQAMDRAMQSFRSGNGEFASNLTRTVKANPIPVVLSSVGLAWLAMANKNPPAAAQVTSESSTKEKSSGPGAKDRTRQAMGSARNRASNAARSFSGQGAKARDGFTRMQQDQPFLLGALGLALGAAVGGALPRSQREDEMIGKYGDQVRDAAKRKGEQASTGAAQAADPGREDDGRSEASSVSASGASNPQAPR